MEPSPSPAALELLRRSVFEVPAPAAASSAYELSFELQTAAAEIEDALRLGTVEPLSPALQALAEEALGAVHRLQAITTLFSAVAEVEAGS